MMAGPNADEPAYSILFPMKLPIVIHNITGILIFKNLSHPLDLLFDRFELLFF